MAQEVALVLEVLFPGQRGDGSVVCVAWTDGFPDVGLVGGDNTRLPVVSFGFLDLVFPLGAEGGGLAVGVGVSGVFPQYTFPLNEAEAEFGKRRCPPGGGSATRGAPGY